MASDRQLIVRLIGSDSHIMPKKELLRTIRQTGTDRYDKDTKQISDYFYGPHRVDFFGTLVEAVKLDVEILRMKNEFGTNTRGDRGQYVIPDIAIIYKAENCDMIQHVYNGRLTSDCSRFRGQPKEALEDVREI